VNGCTACRFLFVSPPLSSLHLFYSTRRLWLRRLWEWLRRGLSLPLGALSARRSPALPCFTVNIAVYALFGNRNTYIRIPPALYTFNGSGHHLCWKSARCVSLDSRCHKGPHSRRKAVKLVLSSATSSTRSALIKPLASASNLPSPRLRRSGQSRPMQSRRPAFKPNVCATLHGGLRRVGYTF